MTTISEYAEALLPRIGAQPTWYNLIACAAWKLAEGSQAAWNPFDTTEDAPGATDYNSVGVKNYPDEATGVSATAATLLNGLYGGTLTALRLGNDAYAVARAVGTSPWGTGDFSEEVTTVMNDSAYLEAIVAGSSGPAPPPTPGVCSVNLPILQNGSQGDPVKSLQVLLNGRANQHLAVDGAFGPLTEDAVLAVQRFYKIAVDGVVGADTWTALIVA